MRHIRVACPADRDAVSQLRMAEYRRSSEFELVDASALAWDCGNAASVVLAAWDGDRCVATMQGTVVRSATDAGELLECRLSLPSDRFPALVLTRAATLRELRGSGLNSALRYHFLVAGVGLQCALGSVYVGAPRSGVMAAVGYEFLSGDFWEAEVRPRRVCQLAYLPGARIAEAAGVVRELARDTLAEFPWRGAPLSFGVGPNQSLQRTRGA